MLHLRKWSIQLPLLAMLLAGPALASQENDAANGFFTYVGCMADAAAAGANLGFAASFCYGLAYNMPY